MLHLRVIDGVPGYVAREAERFAGLVQLVVKVEHGVLVKVIPAQRVVDENGDPQLGLYYLETAQPTIALAGDLRKEVVEYGKTNALEMFRDTFAHELAHYEQWRDGRPVQERGVNVRARNIVRKVREFR
jgi:hypothetical protein